MQLKCDVITVLLQLTSALAVKEFKQATLSFDKSLRQAVPTNHSPTARPISLKIENAYF